VADGKEKLDLLKVQFPKYDPKSRTYGSAQIWNRFVANGLIATAFSRPTASWSPPAREARPTPARSTCSTRKQGSWCGTWPGISTA